VPAFREQRPCSTAAGTAADYNAGIRFLHYDAV
jgi:hypothetical protein